MRLWSTLKTYPSSLHMEEVGLIAIFFALYAFSLLWIIFWGVTSHIWGTFEVLLHIFGGTFWSLYLDSFMHFCLLERTVHISIGTSKYVEACHINRGYNPYCCFYWLEITLKFCCKGLWLKGKIFHINKDVHWGVSYSFPLLILVIKLDNLFLSSKWKVW